METEEQDIIDIPEAEPDGLDNGFDIEQQTEELTFQFSSVEAVVQSLDEQESWDKISASEGGDVLKKDAQEWVYKTGNGTETSITAAVAGTDLAERHGEILENLYSHGFAVSEFMQPDSNTLVREVYFADEKGRISYEIFAKDAEKETLIVLDDDPALDWDFTEEPQLIFQETTPSSAPIETPRPLITINLTEALAQAEAVESDNTVTRTENLISAATQPPKPEVIQTEEPEIVKNDLRIAEPTDTLYSKMFDPSVREILKTPLEISGIKIIEQVTATEDIEVIQVVSGNLELEPEVIIPEQIRDTKISATEGELTLSFINTVQGDSRQDQGHHPVEAGQTFGIKIIEVSQESDLSVKLKETAVPALDTPPEVHSSKLTTETVEPIVTIESAEIIQVVSGNLEQAEPDIIATLSEIREPITLRTISELEAKDKIELSSMKLAIDANTPQETLAASGIQLVNEALLFEKTSPEKTVISQSGAYTNLRDRTNPYTRRIEKIESTPVKLEPVTEKQEEVAIVSTEPVEQLEIPPEIEVISGNLEITKDKEASPINISKPEDITLTPSSRGGGKENVPSRPTQSVAERTQNGRLVLRSPAKRDEGGSAFVKTSVFDSEAQTRGSDRPIKTRTEAELQRSGQIKDKTIRTDKELLVTDSQVVQKDKTELAAIKNPILKPLVKTNPQGTSIRRLVSYEGLRLVTYPIISSQPDEEQNVLEQELELALAA